MLVRLLLSITLWLTGAVFAATPDATAKAWIAQHQVVKIGVVADEEPYSVVRNGVASGFSIDVLEEIARRTGLRFDYKAGSWPEIYSAFQRGELDAINEISWREERAAFTLFTEPYHHRRVVVMQDAKHPLPAIRKLEDLRPYRIGLVRDIYYKSVFAKSGIAVTEYDDLPNLVRALAFGWVEAIVGPEVTLAYFARIGGLNHLQTAGSVAMDGFEMEDFRIGVRKDLPQLHRIIAAALADIPRERMAEMLSVWQDYGGKSAQADTSFRLAAQQANYVRRLGPVRVGMMRDYAPFSFVDGGKSQGLTVDVLARIEDLTGMSVMPVIDHWPVLLEMFKRGEIDVLADISRTPARLEFARFTDPYHIIPNVAFTRNTAFRLNSVDDLAGQRIALGTGIFYEQALRQRFGDAVSTFGAQDAMFRALAEGSVDVVLASLQNGNHWVSELKLTDVRIAGELTLPEFAGEDLRFGVRPALEPLAGIMNQALAAISPTERRSIKDRWLGASAPVVAPRVALSDSEKAWLNAKKKLIVCVDPDWMPLEAIDAQGRHTGIAADYLAAMTQALGVTTEVLHVHSWQESAEAAQARRCDMFSMAMQTPQRRIYMDFTTPYYTIPNVLLARIEAPYVEGLDEFAGKRVGIVRGYAFAELLRTRHPRLNLVEVDDERDGLARVQRRELDGYIGALATVNYHLRELGYADIKVISRVPGDWALSLGTRNDEPELRAIAQKMVDSLTDEQRHTIENRWHSIQLQEKPDMTWVWRAAVAVALVLALLFLWNWKLGNLNRQLAQLTVTDPLTQLGNRKYFDQEYNRDFRWLQRQGQGFAVAMIDIDHFKQVNDRFGHAVGDDCLRALAQCLRQHLRRETDRLARIGGEEFVVFMPLPQTGEADLLARFEKLRIAVAALTITTETDTVSFTISMGLACGIPALQDTAANWLKRADDALYAAKNNGRNRIECARPE